MKLNDVEMLQLMPQFMKADPTVKSLCKSVDILIRYASDGIDSISVWGWIDKLGNGTLDELAWELDIDWWETSWSLQEKRNTIKTVFNILDKRGTKAAIINAIKNAFGSGYVEEWFEYNGQPYYFIAGTDEILTEDKIDKFMKLIDISKNERSKLEMIAAAREVKGFGTLGSTVYGYSTSEVY